MKKSNPNKKELADCEVVEEAGIDVHASPHDYELLERGLVVSRDGIS